MDFSKHIAESCKIDDGPPARYQLKVMRVNLDKLSDEDSKLRKFTVGKRDFKYPNWTLLLVGATGSGKSTLINALVNFVMGVKFEDKIWFEIVVEVEKKSQLDSQTTAVSVYQVFGFEGKTLPYSLTIIDTPGYGDTRGIEHDDFVTEQLQDLFCVSGEVTSIDAVGLVLKATENRLDERLAYIFNSVTSLFGRNMEHNIVALMTHSDRRTPSALQALNELNVKCARDKKNIPIHFRFNNCQKEKIEDDKGAEEAAQFAFETTEKGMKGFIDFLRQCLPQSLKTTVEVLKERIRLTACIQNMKERIETTEKKQEAIKRNREELSQHEEEMKKNQFFTINMHVVEKVKVPIEGAGARLRWFYSGATTCNNCKENCHYPGCTWAPNSSKCEVMKNGRCTSCTRRCPVKDHVKENWKYAIMINTMKMTHKEMKARYEESKTQTEEKTSLLEHLEKEIITLKKEKVQCLDEAFQHIEKLEKIALNVDSAFTYVHLEFLMEKMEERRDTEKIKKLESMKKRIDERNKTGANYLRKCKEFEKKEIKMLLQ